MAATVQIQEALPLFEPGGKRWISVACQRVADRQEVEEMPGVEIRAGTVDSKGGGELGATDGERGRCRRYGR
jgi:hypothetical protein